MTNAIGPLGVEVEPLHVACMDGYGATHSIIVCVMF